MTDMHESLVSLSVKHRKTTPGLCFVGILVIGLLCRAAIGQNEHPITQADVAALLSVIENADRVAVFSVNETEAERQIYTSTSPKDLQALRTSISIESPPQWFRCACDPSTVIRLFRRNKEIGEIDLFDGTTIRFTNWSSDAEISNKTEWFEWLDRRGIKTPRMEFEQRVVQDRKYRAAEERWIKAMPSSLVPLWPPVAKVIPMGEYETGPLDSALSSEFPDKQARILKLMAWFGNGTGPWSGYPVYESVPEQMLLEYSTPELLAAVSGEQLNEDETEGAARLFAGWNFNHSRPQDNALLPADLKRHLLEHSLKSTDEDKRGRAEHWLAAKVRE
jgi:hypothetical protein